MASAKNAKKPDCDAPDAISCGKTRFYVRSVTLCHSAVCALTYERTSFPVLRKSLSASSKSLFRALIKPVSHHRKAFSAHRYGVFRNAEEPVLRCGSAGMAVRESLNGLSCHCMMASGMLESGKRYVKSEFSNVNVC